MLTRSHPRGALFAPPWHRPFLRYVEGEAGGGAGEPPASGAAPPAATTPPAGDTPKVDAAAEARVRELIAERDALKGKADKWDAAEQEKLSEIEKANQRATAAEQQAAKDAAERLQLQVAVDNGITKAERALLTATTDADLASQVAAILALRAPGAASAQAAGITAGGAAPQNKPASLEAAIEAAYAAKK